jgi:hypothetical protein
LGSFFVIAALNYAFIIIVYRTIANITFATDKLTPMKLDILAFGVHPDDVELGCSGTLLGRYG